MKWKCKLTGNILELPDYEYDNMKTHDGYELIEEDKQEEKKPVAKKTKE